MKKFIRKLLCRLLFTEEDYFISDFFGDYFMEESIDKFYEIERKINSIEQEKEALLKKHESYLKRIKEINQFFEETRMWEEFNAWSQYKSWGTENKWNTYKFGDKLNNKQ